MTAKPYPSPAQHTGLAPVGVTAEARGWRVSERPGSGLYVVAPNGNILFRVDLKRQCIFGWDKREGREVEVMVGDLFATQKAV